MAERDGVGGEAAEPAQTAGPDAPAETVEAAEALEDAEALEPAEPVPAGAGRRVRSGRPLGSLTPSFGLSLAAIRTHRGRNATEGTEELRRSLADSEAQANELRETLDALRQALDDTTPAHGVGAVPRRRRRGVPALIGLGLAALATVGLVVVGLVAVLTGGNGAEVAIGGATPSAASSAAPSAGSATPSAAASAESSAGSAAPGPRTRPMPWPGGALLTPPGAPTTGPGVDAPGTDVTLAIDDDLASIDVYERAVLAAPAGEIALALPELSAWPATFADGSPSVADLQVEVDGVAVRPQATGGGWQVPAPDGAGSSLVLRYRLTGTIVNLGDNPSDTRSLIAVPSLTGQASLAASLPVTVRITDPRVLSISCLDAGRDSVSCYSESDGTFTGTLPAAGSPVAVVQADVRPL